MSKRVTTVALCWVARTVALHDGHVKMFAPGAGGFGDRSAVAAWKENHSFKQAPQKV